MSDIIDKVIEITLYQQCVGGTINDVEFPDGSILPIKFPRVPSTKV